MAYGQEASQQPNMNYPYEGLHPAQNNDPNANIDPALLQHTGSWPKGEGESIATNEEVAQDVDRSMYDTTTYTPITVPFEQSRQAAFPVSSTDQQTPWQQPRTPQHRYPTRQSTLMLLTPDASSGSFQPGQHATAHQGYGYPGQNNNRFASLGNLGTSHGFPGLDFEAQGRDVQETYHTPQSQPQQYPQYPDTDGIEQSPSLQRNLPYHTHDQPSQAVQYEPVPPLNNHGWPQHGLVPVEDIPTWSTDGFHLAHIHGAPSPPANPQPNGKGKGKAPAARSQRSGQSNGEHTCDHDGCDKQFVTKSELAHHRRYHAPGDKPCAHCSKTFHFDKDLLRHMATHSDLRRFLCPHSDCPFHRKGFKRNDHLNRHIRNKHNRGEGHS